MNIQSWLEQTETPTTLGLPAALRAREPAAQDALRPSPRHKRPRHLPSSDSSLLRVDRPLETPGAAADDDLTFADDAAASIHSPPVQYARRPRHKTRPDTYEPRKDDAEQRRKKHHKPKERRSKRRDKPDGLLKPKENLGLFKKGRASSPVRGRGLPDLVFSEMRFLQKHSDSVRQQPTEDSKRERKRKERHDAQKEEISAYFGTKPALTERKHEANSRDEQGHAVIPSIELHERPYLGFGSRGTRHSSVTTYSIPWSETVRHASHSVTPQPHRLAKLQALGSGDASDSAPTDGVAVVRPSVRDATSSNGKHLLEEADGTTATQVHAASIPTKNPKKCMHSLLQNRPVETSKPSSSHKGREDLPGNWYDPKYQEIVGPNENDIPAPRSSGLQITPAAEEEAVQSQSPGGSGGVKKCSNSTTGTGCKDNVGPSQVFTRSSSPLGKLLRQCDDACNEAAAEQHIPGMDILYYGNDDFEGTWVEEQGPCLQSTRCGQRGLYGMQLADEDEAEACGEDRDGYDYGHEYISFQGGGEGDLGDQEKFGRFWKPHRLY